MAPTFGPPSLLGVLVMVVAPDDAFLTQLVETQLLQSPSEVTQSSSALHDGQAGALFGHCTHRLNRE
jgi:hypothetical protein